MCVFFNEKVCIFSSVSGNILAVIQKKLRELTNELSTKITFIVIGGFLMYLSCYVSPRKL